MIDLDALGKLTPEQWKAMPKEQLLAIDAGMALLSIQTKAAFLNVALENGHLTSDDAHKLKAIDGIIQEMLQKAYPNGGWDKR